MTGANEAARISPDVVIQKPNSGPAALGDEPKHDVDASSWEVHAVPISVPPEGEAQVEGSAGGSVSPQSADAGVHQVAMGGFSSVGVDEAFSSPENAVVMTQQKKAAEGFTTTADAINSPDVLPTAEQRQVAPYHVDSRGLPFTGLQAHMMSPAGNSVHALETASIFHQGYNVEFPELGSLPEESTTIKMSSSQLDSDMTRHPNHDRSSFPGALLPDDSASMCHSALRSLQNVPTSSTDLTDHAHLAIQPAAKSQSVSGPPLSTLEAAASVAHSYSEATSDSLQRRTLCVDASTLECGGHDREESHEKRGVDGILPCSQDVQAEACGQSLALGSVPQEDAAELSAPEHVPLNTEAQEVGDEASKMSERVGDELCDATPSDAATSCQGVAVSEDRTETHTERACVHGGGVKGHERDQAVQPGSIDDPKQDTCMPDRAGRGSPDESIAMEVSAGGRVTAQVQDPRLVDETLSSIPAAEAVVHGADACQEQGQSTAASPTAPVDTADVVLSEAEPKPDVQNTLACPNSKGEQLSQSAVQPTRLSGDMSSDSTGFKCWYNRRVSRATSSGSRASVGRVTSASSFFDLGGPTGALVNSTVEECRDCVREILTAAAEASHEEATSEHPSRTILQRLLCAKHTMPLPAHMSSQPRHPAAASGTHVDQACSQHARALGLLYLQCTGLASPGPRGGHWERLGFQGTNPVTDFRAGGALALAHMMSLFVHDEARARAIWKLSVQEPVFPFALLGINITKWALDLMEMGALNGVAVKRASLIDAVEKWYIGTFFYFERQWRHKPCSIPNLGFRISATEKHAKDKVNAMVNLARGRRTS